MASKKQDLGKIVDKHPSRIRPETTVYKLEREWRDHPNNPVITEDAGSVTIESREGIRDYCDIWGPKDENGVCWHQTGFYQGGKGKQIVEEGGRLYLERKED